MYKFVLVFFSFIVSFTYLFLNWKEEKKCVCHSNINFQESVKILLEQNAIVFLFSQKIFWNSKSILVKNG